MKKLFLLAATPFVIGFLLNLGVMNCDWYGPVLSIFGVGFFYFGFLLEGFPLVV